MSSSSTQSANNRHHPDVSLRRVGAGEWLRVVIQTARDLWSLNILEWASSLAFFGFISAIPLLIGILIVESYLLNSGWIASHVTDLMANFLPEGGAELGNIVEAAVAERRRVGILSLAILFISGRRVLGVLTKGLNQVSDVDRQDGSFARRIGIELALLTGLVLFLLLALITRPLLNLAWSTVRFVPGPDSPAMSVLTGAFRVIPIAAIFVLVYAFVPYGERLWRATFLGAGAATVMLLVAETVFNHFADRIWANMGLLYGPLALASILLTWLWCVAIITLVGGGLASHIKVMVLERRSAQQTHQRHVGE